MLKLAVLGTGHALVTELYNTCYAISDPSQTMLLDAGGGNGILTILKRMSIPIRRIRHMFISHAHTDHLLGCVWVVRAVAVAMRAGAYEGCFHIYAGAALLDVLAMICRATLKPADAALIGCRILLHDVTNGAEIDVDDWRMTCFDTGCTQTEEYGCRLVFPNGLRLVYLGDEPYHPTSRRFAEGCDWLLAEAYCLYEDRALFRPYQTGHSTVKDICEQAERLHVQNLVLAHTEDAYGSSRAERFKSEGEPYYHGKLHVPNDGDMLTLDGGAAK